MVVFDDIQWGEETFLDLIEHVALLSSGASILLFCMARPELAERRPAWPVTLRLEPLGDEDVDELIPQRIGGDLREKIARAAGGNPLFIEEMLAMAGEAEGDVVVPPTLRALLAARLDQLEPAERSVLERGAIEGEIFHRGAVQALAPDESQVTPRLAALVRKELISPDKPQLAGEDALPLPPPADPRRGLRRAAEGDPADLHQRFASWLEEHGTELVELDEILGYHLEQTCRYRAELGMPDDGIAGRRGAATPDRRRPPRAPPPGLWRRHKPARARRRSRPAGRARPGPRDRPHRSLFWAGRGRRRAAARRIPRRESRRGRRSCRRALREDPGGHRSACSSSRRARRRRLAALVEQALPVFQAAGDDLALYIAYSALA